MLRAAKPGALVVLEVHTVDDPAVTKDGPVSEFADEIQYYFAHNELLAMLSPHLRVLRYQETLAWDHSHGEPHRHGMAALVGRIPETGAAQ